MQPSQISFSPPLTATLLALAAGCSDAPTPPPAPRPVDVLDPPTARMAQVEEYRRDLATPRHPSDGGGSARLALAAGERASVRVGEAASWTIVYEAGPLGIAEGGAVYFMPEVFWGWSPPQDVEPRYAGFTRIRSDAEGIVLTTQNLGGSLLHAEIGGRALAPGETITIEYGAGPAGARCDSFAERGARLWISVDGDGDGVRKPLPDSPTVDVLPGPPARLAVTVTSSARPGSAIRLTLAALDAGGNHVTDVAGDVRLTLTSGAGWELPANATLRSEDAGSRTFDLTAPAPGIYRIAARLDLEGPEALGTSNPLRVSEDAQSVLFGDLHGHSNLSDGTGLPEDYFRFAREVAALDFVSLTDHDHFGVLFLDQHPEMWAEIKAQVAAFHEPERFVTLLGYEWTSWIHGHRHVIYFDDTGEVHSSVDPEVETPRQLWDRLRGQRALTFAHHSAGEPIPTNWTFAPDPVLEPVTEIMSVHGSSEAADSPARVRGAIRGNFVRDVLDFGYRLGFIGSGDSHDGHPGQAHLDPGYGYLRGGPDGVGERLGNGGLAAILGAECTRDGVLEALRARRVYATSGPRILLEVDLLGRGMGSIVSAGDLPEHCTLALEVVGTSAIKHVDLVRSGEVVARMDAGAELELAARVPVDALEAGEYVYVRAVQADGGMAWSSPIYVE